MLRLIAKWYISRTIDCNRYLPAWVERRIASDRQLKQFYDQSKRLAAQMRATETALVSHLTLEGGANVELLREGTSRSNRSAAMFATFAVGMAAVALFTTMPFFNRTESNSDSESMAKAEVNGGERTEVVEVDTIQFDPQRVRDMIASGQSLVKRLKQGSDRMVDPAVERDLDQLASLVNLDIDQFVKPVSDLGTSYGELLSKLDKQTEIGNRRLISGGIGAWQYFIQKVPQSAASLAGL